MTGRIHAIPLQRRAWPGSAAALFELRRMIEAARPEILAAGARTARRIELFHELAAILQELAVLDESAVDAPDLTPVRQHWKQVRGLLGPAAGCGQVAQITDLLITLFSRDGTGRQKPSD